MEKRCGTFPGKICWGGCEQGCVRLIRGQRTKDGEPKWADQFQVSADHTIDLGSRTIRGKDKQQ